ncbi:lanthionine synthetase C family protein [Streptomyces sp.]|uniref:lanthionine synthetase C family protein n=1 Tax=Streptomyces sp. TaxID=1931 RepID=UPI002F417AD9
MEEIARQLSVPESLVHDHHVPAQSLSKGPAGIALLHIERAHTGKADWRTARSWVQAAALDGISGADDACLLFGVPALAFVLHAAEADGAERYASARDRLDTYVTALAHRRIGLAHARIDRGEPPAFAEYDLLHGLSGIGAHLLQHAPGDHALERTLSYLVRLTEPLRVDRERVPGWWVHHDPHVKQSTEFPGGHSNFGIAHGITGPLALLAQALRRGVAVDGQSEAVHTICTWLDTWRQESDAGPWWPQWITRDQLGTGRPGQSSASRPSWCYGTPGIARAQQLVGIALADKARQQMAERALAYCVSDRAQLRQITDTSLCHGWAGLYQTTWRAAQDALTPEIGLLLPPLADLLLQHSRAGRREGGGLLEGEAGLALALHTAAHPTPPISGWDACLLIN